MTPREAQAGDLPEPVRRALPRHARAIYRAAFNNALVRYGAAREAIAHRIGWMAVKKHYVQISSSVWIPRTRSRRVTTSMERHRA